MSALSPLSCGNDKSGRASANQAASFSVAPTGDVDSKITIISPETYSAYQAHQEGSSDPKAELEADPEMKHTTEKNSP